MKSILEFEKAKSSHRRISMVTSYDSWSAKILESSPIDCILVGDSAMMTMHGRRDTVSATVDIMEYHVRAVRSGAPTKFIIGDMPFLAHRLGRREMMEAVRRLISAGANAVKIEGLSGSEDDLKYLVESGVPLMGHLGLTPQSVNVFGGFKVQATESETQKKLLTDALALQNLGAFALVLECVPQSLASEVTRQLKIPTIGIGAGLECDGQVLVFQDLLGADPGFKPRFVRRYANIHQTVANALTEFHSDISEKKFPNHDESFP